MFKLKRKKQAGMSIVELLVVLSIFAVISSVAIFNFGDFQSQIDIRNLASDIASKIIEAQKASISGLLPPLAQQSSIDDVWKPSYGVYFNRIVDDESFYYFTDLGTSSTQDHKFTDTDCVGSGECLEKITITKGNYISGLDVYYQSAPTTPVAISDDLTISFMRPSSSAFLYSNGSVLVDVSYVQITIISPKSPTALIKVYPSGRIQVN